MSNMIRKQQTGELSGPGTGVSGGQFTAHTGGAGDIDSDLGGVNTMGERAWWETDGPIEHRTMVTEKRRAAGFVEEMHNHNLNMEPEYQRDHVWDDERRLRLMRTWLEGAPVPAICINERYHHQQNFTDSDAEYAVIDGKQRLETARRFLDDELAVPAQWFHPDDINPDAVKDSPYGPSVSLSGLTASAKTLVTSRMMIPTITAQVSSVEDEAALYYLLDQGGVEQSTDDLERAARVANRHHNP